MRRALVRVSIGWLALWLCTSIAAAPTKRVLILHSYHQGLYWTDSIQRGLEAALADSGVRAELYTEYMDSIRFQRLLRRREVELLGTLRAKYGPGAPGAPDILVVSETTPTTSCWRIARSSRPAS